jgi:2-dehydro-3-deoxyphosphogluconate aldolase/(4S)-4-hydroxy-2-oxoglutarate aldolase
MSVIDDLEKYRIVPVVVLDSPEQAQPLGDALAAGGLPVAEVTFRTSAAAESIRIISQRDDVVVGAGTVLTTQQVEEAVSAGARFIVSPGTSLAVVHKCQELGVPVLPGAVTATEIQALIDEGVTTIKFFPAEASGGAAAIRALAAPFSGVSFVPTGGIKLSNAADYLALPCVKAVGGSWMVPSRAIRSGDFGQVSALAAEAVATLRAA